MARSTAYKTVEIPSAIHTQIAAAARREGLSIAQYAARLLAGDHGGRPLGAVVGELERRIQRWEQERGIPA